MTTPMHPKLSRALCRLLQEKEQQLQQLSSLLDLERNYLEQGNAEDILQSSQDKSEMLNKIDSTHSKLTQLLAGIGKEQTAAEIEYLLQQLPSSVLQPAKQCWQNIIALTAKCHKLNTVNGCLIAVSYQSTRRLFEKINTRSFSAPLYDKYGDRVGAANSYLSAKT